MRLRVQLARKLEERGLPTALFGIDVLELEPGRTGRVTASPPENCRLSSGRSSQKQKALLSLILHQEQG